MLQSCEVKAEKERSCQGYSQYHRVSNKRYDPDHSTRIVTPDWYVIAFSRCYVHLRNYQPHTGINRRSSLHGIQLWSSCESVHKLQTGFHPHSELTKWCCFCEGRAGREPRGWVGGMKSVRPNYQALTASAVPGSAWRTFSMFRGLSLLTAPHQVLRWLRA